MKALLAGLLVATVSVTAFAGDGTNSGGGGNTVGGVLIENFQQDTFELPVATAVQERLFELKRDIPRFGRDLDARALETKWYILPSPIAQLPSNITGIAIATDQTAVQRSREVYVDASIWKKMTPAQQTGLVLHELVLAQYLFLKSALVTSAPFRQQALSMSDMRRISKLVQTYTQAQSEVLAKELVDRNYGYYVTRKSKLDRADKLQGVVKTVFELMCAKPETRLLSQTAIAFTDFYSQYRGLHAYRSLFERPNLSLSAENSEEESAALEFSAVPALVSMKGLYPQELLDAKVDTFSGADLFDSVFPGVRGTQADRDLGEKSCAAYAKFNLKTLLFTTL